MPNYRVDCARFNNTEGSESHVDGSSEAAEAAVWEEVERTDEDGATLGVHQGLPPPENGTDWRLKYEFSWALGY